MLQQGQSDCGVACLLTIINSYGGVSSLERLRELSGTSKQGTSLLGLLNAAQQMGFETEGLEAEAVENLYEINTPSILHVIIEERLQHYLVYLPSENKYERLNFFDPAKGFISLSIDELNAIWKSRALLDLKPSDKFIKRKSTESRWRWFLNLVSEDLNILVTSLVIGVIVSALGLSTAIFTQKLIDEILPKGDVEKLIVSLVLLTIILMSRAGLSLLRGMFLAHQGKNFNNRIIDSFYHNLLGLPKLFFDTRKSGELIARMNDTRRIQTTLSLAFGSVAIDFLYLIVSIFFIFTLSVTIGFVSLIVIPFFFLLAYLFNGRIVRNQKYALMGYALTESNFIDTVQGILDIKGNTREAFFEKQNTKLYGEFQQRIFELGVLNIKFSSASEFVGSIFTVTVFGISSWLFLNDQLLLGQMVALLSLITGIIPSASRILIANIQLQEARVVFDRMHEFTSLTKEPIGDNSDKLSSFESLHLKNVSFRFPGRPRILESISFQINRGEIVALMGESGRGKSTTLQLIQKFYSIEDGSILYNGMDIKLLNTRLWRQSISIVPQDLKIFNGGLLFNITLSDELNDIQDAIKMCNDLGFKIYFEKLPNGYLTLLGEDGINISGGQKQLVGIARALYRKPQFLILDEATSAMDSMTEDFILTLLQNLKGEISVLLVTHKFKVAKIADRMYNLENGTVNAITYSQA